MYFLLIETLLEKPPALHLLLDIFKTFLLKSNTGLYISQTLVFSPTLKLTFDSTPPTPHCIFYMLLFSSRCPTLRVSIFSSYL